MELIKRKLEYLKGYKEYCRELYDNNITYFRCMPPDLVDEAWFLRTKPIYDRRETEMTDGRSRSIHYWAIDGERFIGEFQLRLDFTDQVLFDIGSIGYAVRVSEWGRGYGHAILKLGIEKAKEFGMSKLLFTVNEKNERSIRLIEKIGAVYKDTIEAYNDYEGDHLLRRYVLTL